MDSPNKGQVQQFTFQNLSPIQDLNQSANGIQTYIKGHQWTDSYNCITELRKINKFHPQFVPQVLDRYSSTILDLLSTGKTVLVKNIMKLIKQLFDAGAQTNVEKAVYAFLPVIIKKASTQIGSMKIIAQQVLTSFTCNCGYQASFVFASEFCQDKNSAIADLSVKLLAALLQKVGSGIMQLSEDTLTRIMKALSTMIDGKRQTLRTSALDICMFVCESIGSENYLKLMQFCLLEEEVRSMGTSMQSHRQSKQKPIKLKQAIHERKTEVFNESFFNNQKNFVPLGQKQMNYDYNNQNQNYNGNYNNGYNQNNYSNQGNYYNI